MRHFSVGQARRAPGGYEELGIPGTWPAFSGAAVINP
jgi:hypothetical protein